MNLRVLATAAAWTATVILITALDLRGGTPSGGNLRPFNLGRTSVPDGTIEHTAVSAASDPALLLEFE